jgi:uncharacterized protein YkwD
MKHFGLKHPLVLFISLLVTANLACSLTNSVFQAAPSKTARAPITKTSSKKSATATKKATPTHRLPPAFLTRSAVPDGNNPNPNRPAKITSLPGPTEELGYEEDQTAATSSNSGKKTTATITRTPVPGTPFTPTRTISASPTATITNATNPTNTSVPSCGSSYNHQYESDLLDWINEERQGQGLLPYSRSKKLDIAALRHSLDMACKQDWFDQKGSDGSTIGDRINDAGYDFSRADQTIYAASGISDSPKSAFDTWKSLPTSKSILFDEDYTDIGIGYVNNPNSTYGGYFTAVYAQP